MAHKFAGAPRYQLRNGAADVDEQRVGFEVRAELRTDTSEPWVQLTRAQADDLELHPERTVWLRPHGAATKLLVS